MTTIATIGVHGFDAEAFVERLRQADIRLLLDVRQHRGVRGAAYAWANARRLEALLAEAGIAYEHHPELAPTTEMRQLQYAEDRRRGVGKRSRRELGPEYVQRYTAEVLDRVDLAPLVAALPDHGVAALLCVEREPAACHRSLLAARVVQRGGGRIADLKP